ncbi:hypothetical protein PSHT_07329, partial [Puccinia striiformis]
EQKRSDGRHHSQGVLLDLIEFSDYWKGLGRSAQTQMFIGGQEKVEGIFTDLRKGRHAITAHAHIPGRVVLVRTTNSSFVANVFFPELPLLFNTFVQQRLRNDIRYLRLDTGPCPPTSGFKFHLTTHNPAQALKIQDRPNHNLVSLLPITIKRRLSTFDLSPSSSQQPLGRLTVATSPEQNPYSAIPKTPTLIVARQTSDLWSLFKSVIQAFTLPTRNELQRPRRKDPREQSSPFQCSCHWPSSASVPGSEWSYRCQPGDWQSAANIAAIVHDGAPLPDSEVQGTVTESTNSQDGSLITLDYCLYVSTCNHLSSSKSKSKNKDDSENIVPLENAMPSMQSNLHNWTWADLRTKIIRIIGSSQHLDAYIACLLNAGQIRFHFYIPNSHACPLRETFL